MPASVLMPLVLALLLAVVVLGLAWWWERTRSSRASRARWRVASAGETKARKILEEEGYTLVDQQLVVDWTLWVDGEPVEVRSRADGVVERDGLRFVAEVKTGQLAPNPRNPATRRQLLEYLHVFEVDGVLLVDMVEERIFEVRFTESPEAAEAE
jgi:hypothetical protein